MKITLEVSEKMYALSQQWEEMKTGLGAMPDRFKEYNGQTKLYEWMDAKKILWESFAKKNGLIKNEKRTKLFSEFDRAHNIYQLENNL